MIYLYNPSVYVEWYICTTLLSMLNDISVQPFSLCWMIYLYNPSVYVECYICTILPSIYVESYVIGFRIQNLSSWQWLILWRVECGMLLYTTMVTEPTEFDSWLPYKASLAPHCDLIAWNYNDFTRLNDLKIFVVMICRSSLYAAEAESMHKFT